MQREQPSQEPQEPPQEPPLERQQTFMSGRLQQMFRVCYTQKYLLFSVVAAVVAVISTTRKLQTNATSSPLSAAVSAVLGGYNATDVSDLQAVTFSHERTFYNFVDTLMRSKLSSLVRFSFFLSFDRS